MRQVIDRLFRHPLLRLTQVGSGHKHVRLDDKPAFVRQGGKGTIGFSSLRQLSYRALFTDVKFMYSREKGVRQRMFRLARQKPNRLTQVGSGQKHVRLDDKPAFVRHGGEGTLLGASIGQNFMRTLFTDVQSMYSREKGP